MSYVWGVAFSKDIGAEKAPRSNSARFVSTVYAFMAMIIVNTYCANLMAFLLQDNFVLPIDGIRDPKVCRSSFCMNIFETFTSHRLLKKSFTCVFPFICFQEMKQLRFVKGRDTIELLLFRKLRDLQKSSFLFMPVNGTRRHFHLYTFPLEISTMPTFYRLIAITR